MRLGRRTLTKYTAMEVTQLLHTGRGGMDNVALCVAENK